MSRIFGTWQDRLYSGTLTKSQIAQFSHAVTPLAERNQRSGKATNLTRLEAATLVNRINEHPVRLTREHTEQGYTWLERHGVRALKPHGATYAEIIKLFSHFTWDGTVEYHVSPGGWATSIAPVWTIHLTNGREFQYYYAPGWRADRDSVGKLWEVS